jgi:hypothetical protein
MVDTPMPKGRANAISKMTARGKSLPRGLAKPFPGKGKIGALKTAVGALRSANKAIPGPNPRIKQATVAMRQKLLDAKAARATKLGKPNAAFQTAKAAWHSSRPSRPAGAAGKGFGKSAAMTSWRAAKPTKPSGA